MFPLPSPPRCPLILYKGETKIELIKFSTLNFTNFNSNWLMLCFYFSNLRFTANFQLISTLNSVISCQFNFIPVMNSKRLWRNFRRGKREKYLEIWKLRRPFLRSFSCIDNKIIWKESQVLFDRLVIYFVVLRLACCSSWVLFFDLLKFCGCIVSRHQVITLGDGIQWVDVFLANLIISLLVYLMFFTSFWLVSLLLI